MKKEKVIFKKVTPRLNCRGKKIGLLSVGDPVGTNHTGSIVYECKCDCGNVTYVRGSNLKSGTTQSCGCKTKEFISQGVETHGGSYSSEYRIWAQMKQRCSNENNIGYHKYGGRGVFVCERWENSFVNFLEDMGTRPKSNSQIDRENNSEGYYKENCRWVSPAQNSLNKRNNRYLTFRGKTQTLKEWADEIGIKRSCLVARLDTMLWSIEDALTKPVDPSGYNRKNNRMICYNNKTQPLKKWAAELGIEYKALWARLNLGLSVYQSFTMPYKSISSNNKDLNE